MNKPADYPEWPDPDLDLGSEVWAAFSGQGGEGVTRDGQPVPRVEKTNLLTIHRCTASETGWRLGHLGFDIPENGDTRPGARWKVESWDPLTLSPSIQHNCGCPLSHGYIKAGKWVPA